MNRRNMFGVGLLISAVVVLTIAYRLNSVFTASLGAMLAYVSGTFIADPYSSCDRCGTSFIEDDESDEISGPRTGRFTFREYVDAMKPRQRTEPGNHKPVSAEDKWFSEPNRSRLADMFAPEETDIPRSRHGVNYPVQADGTVETPHDRMYTPDTYIGPRGKCGRPSAQCSITTCGCVDYRMDRPEA